MSEFHSGDSRQFAVQLCLSYTVSFLVKIPEKGTNTVIIELYCLFLPVLLSNHKLLL